MTVFLRKEVKTKRKKKKNFKQYECPPNHCLLSLPTCESRQFPFLGPILLKYRDVVQSLLSDGNLVPNRIFNIATNSFEQGRVGNYETG